MAKAINQNSVRQQILTALYRSDKGLKAADVTKTLADQGIDRKKIHIWSHLTTFQKMATPPIMKLEDGSFIMTEKGRERYETLRAELEQGQVETELVPA